MIKNILPNKIRHEKCQGLGRSDGSWAWGEQLLVKPEDLSLIPRNSIKKLAVALQSTPKGRQENWWELKS